MSSTSVFSDVSVSLPEHGPGAELAAGFGMWARGPTLDPAMVVGRPLRTSCGTLDVSVYEARGIACAATLVAPHMPEGSLVYIQCDNVKALAQTWLRSRSGVWVASSANNGAFIDAEEARRLSGKLRNSDAFAEAANVTLDALAHCRLRFKWVKGHSVGDGRGWVNALCDDLARMARTRGVPVSAEESEIWRKPTRKRHVR